VQGDGKVGEQLVASDDIHMVAMTGSTATGKRIMEVCSKKLKRLVLELGGKDPMIVFKDADLDKAANDAVAKSLSNCGQGKKLRCCQFKGATQTKTSLIPSSFFLLHSSFFITSLSMQYVAL
jgi:delta 1-pyrroline-5-carboxylate dehydrogenase